MATTAFRINAQNVHILSRSLTINAKVIKLSVICSKNYREEPGSILQNSPIFIGRIPRWMSLVPHALFRNEMTIIALTVGGCVYISCGLDAQSGSGSSS